MPRVHVVHWNAKEAEPLMAQLRREGYDVCYDAKPGPATFREMRASPPHAIVIDLSRLPSHGREIAIALRSTKATRSVPIVFVGGDPAKVDAIRAQLPDATYTTANGVVLPLKQAIRQPTADPVIPVPMMQRYAGRTAAQKLGIREGSAVALIDPPRDYNKVIGALPAGAELYEEVSESSEVVLWFVHDAGEYRSSLPSMRRTLPRAKLWILWRKQKGRTVSEVNERLIRECALEMGFVDYKICSVDPTWSALLFARK